jgi:hypothetical protein
MKKGNIGLIMLFLAIIQIFVCSESFAGFDQFWAYSPEEFTLNVGGKYEKFILVLAEIHQSKGKTYFKEESTLTDDTGTVYYPVMDDGINSEAEALLNKATIRRKKFVSQSDIDQHVYRDVKGPMDNTVKRLFVLFPVPRIEAREITVRLAFTNAGEAKRRFFTSKSFKTKKGLWKYDQYYKSIERPNESKEF